uniref:Cytochrome c oxidase subunit 3 n=1 Tax=Pristaulacus compressus TaxID=1414807 RepID=U5TTZ5_9HYME|nr:cytochrome c oxidase subunit III [Pristaulacus compressus]AGZ13116.1 cytochrome c oxidase subunit III [Pristaulacus compressus]
MMMKLNFSFHLVTISPWPIIISFSLMNLILNLTFFFHSYNFNNLFYSMILLFISFIQWNRDIIRESTFLGLHLLNIINSLKISMIMFIISELFFFISFFWTYFHNFLSPNIEIGNNWPPKNITKFNPFDVPLLNTIILISSGMSITWSHHSLLNLNKSISKKNLILTIFLGLYFTLLQIFEYYSSSFTLMDSIYGSIFFMATGFHGFHIIIGTIFLMTSIFRLTINHFSYYHHFLFEASSWYWHFVDIIWLFLYLFIYWWNF